ncbi:MAG: hypothetical protein ACRYFV_09775 [Janthinobacterium lividum]
MGYPETASGFVINDPKKWTDFRQEDFPLKKFEDHDIDIAIDGMRPYLYMLSDVR